MIIIEGVFKKYVVLLGLKCRLFLTTKWYFQ